MDLDDLMLRRDWLMLEIELNRMELRNAPARSAIRRMIIHQIASTRRTVNSLNKIINKLSK